MVDIGDTSKFPLMGYEYTVFQPHRKFIKNTCFYVCVSRIIEIVHFTGQTHVGRMALFYIEIEVHLLLHNELYAVLYAVMNYDNDALIMCACHLARVVI